MIEVIDTVEGMRGLAASLKAQGRSIGLVPTMGFFHEGHLSLMRRSAAENDATVVSLFVNPTQFGPSEDLEKYPRNLERDTELAAETGAQYLFTPTNAMMYPDGYKTYIKVEEWSGLLCGTTRPVHFRGVTTICNKLFNICRADRAYFGLKDAQQYLIINKMVADLDMNIEIVPMPIVREEDGLAMSSRNVYLDAQQRSDATLLSKSLARARTMIDSGETDAARIKEAIAETLRLSPLIKIDYVEAVCTARLEPVDRIAPGTLIAIAAFLGSTRLIDNLMA